MKNNRYIKMNEFLKRMANILRYNPEFDISNNNFVYSQLMFYNVTNNKEAMYDEARRRSLIFHNFQIFADRMLHMEGRLDEKRNGFGFPPFFWFLNGTIDIEKEIKLYLNFNDVYYEEGLKHIMKFLSDNNISHQSKVASTKRADSICIRIDSIQNAIAIVNFIVSNKTLLDNLDEQNPFVPSIFKIGVAMDKIYSFNGELANIITHYLLFKKEQNDLDNVSIDGFRKHVCYLRNKRTSVMQEDDKFYDMLVQILDSDFEDSNIFKLLTKIHNFEQAKKHTDDQIEALLIQVLMTNYEKYDLGWTINALRRYIESGDASSITKDNGARNILKLTLTKDEVYDFISRQVDTNKRDYLTIYVSRLVDNYNKSKKKNSEEEVDLMHVKRMKTLRDAITKTIIKYNVVQASSALVSYESGDFTRITNEDASRQKLVVLVKPEEIFTLTKLALSFYFGVDLLSCPDREKVYDTFVDEVSKHMDNTPQNISDINQSVSVM